MIRIFEKQPSGKNSITAAKNWINDISKKSNNLMPFWERLEDDIIEAAKYEFSEANPNNWAPISPAWKDEKTSRGRPVTIGIYTGALKRAASTEAIIRKRPLDFYFGLNESIVNDEGDRVSEYAEYFNEIRPIFKYTRNFIKKFIKRKIIQEWIGSK